LEADRLLMQRPGTIKQRGHPMIEQVEEPDRRNIARMLFALMEIFGDMQWQRAPGAAQSEELHAESSRFAILGWNAFGQRRRGERQRGRLTKSHDIVAGAMILPDGWTISRDAFQSAHRLKKI